MNIQNDILRFKKSLSGMKYIDHSDHSDHLDHSDNFDNFDHSDYSDSSIREIFLDGEELNVPEIHERQNERKRFSWYNDIYDGIPTDTSAKLHIKLLSEELKKNMDIDTVHVDPAMCCTLDEISCSEFFDIIGNLSNLRQLDVSTKKERKQLQISWLTKALQKAVNLKSLRLYNIELLGSKEDFTQFNDVLLVLSCSTMRKFVAQHLLFPKYYGLDKFILESLSKIPSQSSLEDIMIAYDEVDKKYAKISAEAIQSLCQTSKLKRLSLNGFQFNPQKLVGIAHALVKPDTTLEYLNLSSNKLCDRDFLIIAYALELGSKINTTKLQGLNIANNKLEHKAGLALGQILSINSTLKSLNLSCNAIGDKGGVTIAKSLFVNNSLKKLSLNDCSLGDDTLVSIASSFYLNVELCKLSISENSQIKNKVSYKILSEAVKKSKAITDIGLDRHTPRKCAVEIINHCHKNKMSAIRVSERSRWREI